MKFFRQLIDAWLHFMKINFLWKSSLTNLFFEPQTKLNFSSSNPNNFYILTSHTIADKCTLVKYLRVTIYRAFSYPPGFLSQPWQNLYIFISCRYLIPNYWKEISIWMRLLQNLFITNNAWIFWKFRFWTGSLLIYGTGFESDKAVDFTSKNVLYINFCVSCLCTFNPLSSLLKCVTTLVATAYRNMESRQSGRTTYMMRRKESERGPFFKFLNGILFCTIHTRWMKLL